MIGWVRNIMIILFVLSLIYAVLSYNARRKQRAKLLADFNAETPSVEKDVFIAKGLQNYDRSLKPKLIFGVFLVPLAVTLLLGYLAQHT